MRPDGPERFRMRIGDWSATRIGKIWTEQDHEQLLANLQAADQLTANLLKRRTGDNNPDSGSGERDRRTRRKGGGGGSVDRAVRGLVLPGNALARLRSTGILGRPEISVEFQRAVRRYVLRGVESGGALPELGRYVTFAAVNGEPLAWLQPVDSLAPNGAHAFVIAREMLLADVFRVGRTYDAILTRHTFSEPPESARPAIVSEVLFQCAAGYLGLDLTWTRRTSR